MFRLTLAGLLVPALAAAAAPAPAWSDALFEETAHDFGTVPHGPLVTHPFRVTNHTAREVRISALRVSCGCTTATALQGTLAPGQTTVLLAQMDTRRFTGPKTVTIYVQFDQPESKEITLSVTADSRDQLSVAPEALAFGAVPKGGSAAGEVAVAYRGDAGWKVTRAESASTYVEPVVTEVVRGPGEVRYAVKANLKPGVPPGKWYTDIWLTTNAPGSPRIHVPVTVEVRAPLSVSPGAVSFGEVKAGEQAQRKVLVQAGKPFTIKGVEGTDDGLTARVDPARDGTVQGLTLTLTPGAPGPVRRTVKVVTDLPEDGTVEVPVSARVMP